MALVMRSWICPVQIVLEDGNSSDWRPIRNFTDRIEALFADIWEVGPEASSSTRCAPSSRNVSGDIAGRKGALGSVGDRVTSILPMPLSRTTACYRLALTSVQKAWLVSQLPSDEYNFGYNYSSPTLARAP